MNRIALIARAAAGALISLPAAAAEADLTALREEIAQLRQAYESRIAALETRLAAPAAKPGDAAGAAPQAAVAATRKPASEAAFNPAISLVLAGTYARLSQDPEKYAIAGFLPSGGEIGPPRRSFGLGESELGIAANIDPTLRGRLTFALAPEGGATVEEAFIQTLGLGHGATLKAGRFLSGIGYLNGQHAHAWDFADAPLAYQAMLGGRLKNDGVQLKWLAPTDLLVELGAEAASGGAFPSTDRNRNGATLGALFAHVGGDVGLSHSWRTGLSLLGTAPRDRQYEDADSAGVPVTNAFSGRSRTWIADFVWKWAPAGNASVRNLIVQGEYFQRRETGSLAFDVTGANRADAYAARQSGFYAQTVYQFMPHWRVGYRYDRLDAGTVSFGSTLNPADFPLLAAYKPQRNTVMADYSPSEYSRWRLQLARDQSRPQATDNQFWLQYVVSLGAHGAHAF
ncbi:MAG: TonB-dependent receptor [Rhodocyclaceae bacterium]|nr:TonB-dependent receptor [Rhodocyclaceae bacterium]